MKGVFNHWASKDLLLKHDESEQAELCLVAQCQLREVGKLDINAIADELVRGSEHCLAFLANSQPMHECFLLCTHASSCTYFKLQSRISIKDLGTGGNPTCTASEQV